MDNWLSLLVDFKSIKLHTKLDDLLPFSYSETSSLKDRRQIY